jgi:hypothetical protein
MTATHRIWQYVRGVLKAGVNVWERGETLTTIMAAAAAGGLAGLGTIGLGFVLPDLHNWPVLLAAFWIVLLFAVIAPYRLWAAERVTVEAFLEAAKPKIEIFTPHCVTDPKSAPGRAFRTWRIQIANTSTSPVRNCYAKKISFINAEGQQSDSLGMRFKLNTDQPKLIQEFEYKQSFDLAPGGHEFVDIACLDERQGAAALVFMLYAIPGGGATAVRNGIAQEAFPHALIVQVCADDLAHPIECKYRLAIDSLGRLRMDLEP